MNERERIEALRLIFERGATGALLGIGDDAAALVVHEPLVVSVDATVEHVHFERAWLGLDDIGYKATMAALSDLAAMGAAPVGVLASCALPEDVGDDDLAAIAHGQAAACDEVGTQVIGGNLTKGAVLAIHTTVLGRTTQPLRRDGARVGDSVMIAGEVGLAAAGLRRLRDGADAPESWTSAWRRPQAQIAAGLRAAGVASAAIDISDGLASDVAQLAHASGVAVTLDAAAIVGDALRSIGDGALSVALAGGEDYALVVTASKPIEGFRPIGTCAEGAGVWLQRVGHREAITVSGWDHFASQEP